jgi:hypothetical protein
MGSVSQYEVRCESCRVSFPVGTKVCIHCGGRTGPSPVDEPSGMLWTRSTGSPPDVHQDAQRDAQQQEEEEEVRQSPVRVLVTLLWVALAIAFSVVRSCSES